MCFSATASFTAAAATGGMGAAALKVAGQAREVPLASIPLIFGIQQAIEGALWLCLDHTWPAGYAPGLANVFVFIALVVWPLLVPIAVGLVEANETRRRYIAALIPVGVLLSVYSGVSIVRFPFTASVVGSSICYIGDYPYPLAALALYLLCTCGPLLISTDRILRVLGAVVLSGAVISTLFFYTSFVSVWCFFAAAASVAIYLSIEQERAARESVHSEAGRP